MERLSIIVALDALGGNIEKVEKLARVLCGSVEGFKLGWPNLLPAGPRIGEAVRQACPQAMIIADLKLADIAYTMLQTAQHLPWADAVIAHSFLGVEGALDGLKEYLDKNNKKLVLVISMSHPGSREAIDPCLNRLINIARAVRPWGIVAPATRPWIIGIARRELGPHIKILSPGIGAQGAEPGTAIRNGADLEIIGRLITRSPNPEKIINKIKINYNKSNITNN